MKLAYLLIQPSVLLFYFTFHSTEIRLSKSDWDSDSCLLLWTVAVAVSHSLVAHAVLVKLSPVYHGVTLKGRES